MIYLGRVVLLYLGLIVAVSNQAISPARAAPDEKLSSAVASSYKALNENQAEDALAVALGGIKRARELPEPRADDFALVLNNAAYALFLLKREPGQARDLWLEALVVLKNAGLGASFNRLLVASNLTNHDIAQGNQSAAETRAAALVDTLRETPFEGGALQLRANVSYQIGKVALAGRLQVEVIERFPKLQKPSYGDIYKFLAGASDKADTAGDLIGAISLNNARIAILRAYVPDPEQAIRNILYDSYFKAYQKRDLHRAADALEQWSETGKPSDIEHNQIMELARSSGLLALGETSLRSKAGLDLGRARIGLAYAKALREPELPQLSLAWRVMAYAQENAQQYEKARDSLLKALLVANATTVGTMDAHVILNDLARINSLLGDATAAEKFSKRSQTSYDKMLAMGGEPESSYDRATRLIDHAELDNEEGRYRAALDAFEEAEGVQNSAREAGTFKWQEEVQRAQLLHGRALAYHGLKKPKEAENAIVEAVRIADQHYPKNHPGAGIFHANVADFWLVSGRLDAGVKALKKAIAINQIALSKNAPLAVETKFHLAVTLLQQGKRDAAQVALQQVTEARKDVAYRDRLPAAAIEFNFFAWNALRDGEQAGREAAFQALQWTQTASSARALSSAQARLSVADSGLFDALYQRQFFKIEHTRLTNSIQVIAANGDLDAAGAKQRLKQAQSQLAVVEQGLIDADLSLGEAGMTDLGMAKISPLSITQVQALLDSDEALVTFLIPGLNEEVLIGREGSSNRVIAITKESVKFGILPEKSLTKLNQRVAEFRCLMAISDGACDGVGAAGRRGAFSSIDDDTPVADGFPTEVAHALYRDLFGDVENIIASKRSLIIVPPNDLLSLPFQALVTRAPASGGAGPIDWLIRRQAVSILPSISSLRSLRQSTVISDVGKRSFFGIGDPLLGDTLRGQAVCEDVQLANLRAAPPAASILATGPSSSPFALGDVSKISSLEALPDTACELQAVKQSIGGVSSKILLRGEATELSVKNLSKQNELQKYNIISFATHGLIAGEAGASEPALVLTPPSVATEQDDGLLTASEVATLRLNADLVVLSACNTAAGANTNAEGLSGLARAFFHAGARSLLVTHWSVYSRAATQITTGLFEVARDAQKLRPARALRRSILRLLDDQNSTDFQRHPSYWAAFAVVGDR